MTEELEIAIRTLTPLWTGGVDGSMDRVHETGLLGSLRWWYEAVVRGLGGSACDPTEHACIFDLDNYKKAAGLPERQRLSAAGLCDACQLFGATGWRRRFRLQISAQDQPTWTGGRDLNVRPYGRTRGWFLKSGRIGEITVNLQGEPNALVQMSALFHWLETWGNLGPRPQLGYGVFRMGAIKIAPSTAPWEELGSASIGVLPDLRSFVFFKLRFTPKEDAWWTQVSGLRELRGQHDWRIIERLAAQGMVPVMPALKNYLRFEQRWSSNALPHWLFGTLRGDERIRSKLALSWAFRLPDDEAWETRGWVHLPNDGRGRAARTEVTNVLRQALERPQNWQLALGLQAGFRDAALTWAPSASPWQLHSAQAIADFMSTFGREATTR
ncbi:MAG: type III-B CRISPR module RAMP protein Cmr1 [Caldilineales bacterium]|nr:type III-B CRISPR module RAMP protein Cmr1 [Caldilineales bacterium]